MGRGGRGGLRSPPRGTGPWYRGRAQVGLFAGAARRTIVTAPDSHSGR